MTQHLVKTFIFRACAVGGFIALDKEKKEFSLKHPEYILFAILGIKTAVSFLYALDDYYFGFDMSCFKAWSLYTRKYGLSGMYTGEFFLDYPPGYMYVLRITQYIRVRLGLGYDDIGYTFLIKLAPILADIATVVVVYLIAKKCLPIQKALFVTTVLAFCPMTVFNSAVWGQIDSYYTLFIVLALYFISEDKTVPAAVTYAIALLTKPQALLFGPVFLFAMIKRGSVRETVKAVCVGGGFMYVAALPFGKGLNPMWLVNLYRGTMNSYRYFTVNAYNFWAALGKNWKPLADIIGSEYINTVIIVLLLVLTAYCFIRMSKKEAVFGTAFILITVIFTFGTMMHERYMFPAGIIALTGYVMTQKKEYFYLAVTALSVSYMNIAMSMDNQCGGLCLVKSDLALVGVVCTILCLAALIIYVSNASQGEKIPFINKNREFCVMLIITLCYSLTAFFRLGSSEAPETYWQSVNEGDYFVYRLEEYSHISQIWTFSGLGDEYYPDKTVKKGCDFTVCLPDSDGLWVDYDELSHKYVFTWDVKYTDIWSDCVLIRANSAGQVLNEIVFTDADGRILYGTIETPSDINYGKYSPYYALDESYTLPESGDSYYYSTYFDEIYFARSAYEIKNGYSVYETTHPMLGKEIIALGITLFGMNPLGWRIMGVLAGILMIPIMYRLAGSLLKSRKLGVFCALLLALDFMHCTQTRIATVDSFLLLFIMLMYLFMVKFARCDEDDITKQMLCLLLSGIFAGCTVSVKWNGAFAIIGLAFGYFAVIVTRYIKRTDKKKALKNSALLCIFCVFCFIIVPAVVYFVTFSPVLTGDTIRARVSDFFRWQNNMFRYHSNLTAEHPYSSRWYTWMYDKRPVWYAVSRLGERASSIASFGNPIIWMSVIVAVPVFLIGSIRRKNTRGIVTAVSYYGCMLPWAVISRVAFIYHYFPCTVPGIIAVGGVAGMLTNGKNGKKYEKLIWLLPVVAGVAFIVFFPVITGMTVSAEYIDALEIISSWNFI